MNPYMGIVFCKKRYAPINFPITALLYVGCV